MYQPAWQRWRSKYFQGCLCLWQGLRCCWLERPCLWVGRYNLMILLATWWFWVMLLKIRKTKLGRLGKISDDATNVKTVSEMYRRLCNIFFQLSQKIKAGILNLVVVQGRNQLCRKNGIGLSLDKRLGLGAGMAAGRKAGSFGKADDSCRSFHWLAREGWRLGRQWCLSTASCYFWSPMKANLTLKRGHRWLQSKGDIQIACWGQTGGCRVAKVHKLKRWQQLTIKPIYNNLMAYDKLSSDELTVKIVTKGYF